MSAWLASVASSDGGFSVTDPLEFLWPLADAPDPTVSSHVAESWPAGVREQLVALGVLHEAERAERVRCPECHEHVEEVLAIAGSGGKPRFVIPCPEVLRAEVPSAALRQWRVDHGTLVSALASTLSLTGKSKELVVDRLWRLGRTKWNDQSRDVLFARGLHWEDGASVRATLVRSRKPIVFVPLRRPPDEFWRTIPPVLVLSQVAMFGDECIDIESMEVAAAIHDADALATSKKDISLTADDLKCMIRQQVKAEGKMNLTDDAFVAAYRQCGSVREAATFLTCETGQDVSKDKVQRALTREGGAAAVLNSEDSDSVVRGVASQRRDKRGKPLLHSQTTDKE